MNILITGAFKYTPCQLNQIKDLGVKVINMPIESENLPVNPLDVEGIICNGLFLYHDISQFSNLKFIQLTSAGLDRIPLQYILDNEIKLYNARGVYSKPMAEWVLMRILERNKHSEHFNSAQKANRWEKDRELIELSGKKAAIIGAGNVGQEIAKRLSSFDVNITGYDIHKNNIQFFDTIKLIKDFLKEVEIFDYIIITAPLTPDTKNLMNISVLERMKKGSMLINVSRGGILNEEDLINLFSKRNDLYAALDVFEKEPLPEDSILWQMNNIKVSPHNSFVGEGNQQRLFEVVLSNLKKSI